MKKNNSFTNNKSLGKGLVLGSLIAAVATMSASAVVTINASFPSIFTTPTITSFETNGATMAGMTVSVTFSNGSSSFATWATTGATSGAATGTGFSMVQSDTTFSNPFTLTNTSQSLAITGFSMHGTPGKTVFDRTLPNTGTEGSASGRDFEFVSGGTTATVNYSDALKLDSAAAPVGDLFLRMEVLLDRNSYIPAASTTAGTNGDTLTTFSSMQFIQDTDNSLITPIPEPSAGLATALLIGAGLVIRRRKP